MLRRRPRPARGGGAAPLVAERQVTSREAFVLALQRQAGNAAVSSLLSGRSTWRPGVVPVQRCGPTPCDCTPEERLAKEVGASTMKVERVVQRACGPAAIGKRDSCDVIPGFLPPFIRPYLFNVNCDTMAPGTEDRLRKDIKRGDRVIVQAFASIEGQPKYNEYLSCARAERTTAFLVHDIGATVVKVHAHGATAGAKVPRRSVLVYQEPKPEPKSQPSTPPTNVCGPDIDGQLTTVLTDIQQYFRGMSRWRRHRSCQQLEAPFAYSMAWDINQLYLPKTDWLRSSQFASTSPPCSLPQAADGQNLEDPQICGNTVRVNGKCNLAGTVNYAAFGIMMSECWDFYDSAPWYAGLLWTQKPFYNERAMRALIWAWKKVLNDDDPGPPTEFAWATFDRGPSGRPNVENRPQCKAPCESTATPPHFTFTWGPYHD